MIRARATRASVERPAGSFPDAGGARGAISADSPELYRLLVESVRDYAIFALDPEGHIITWNAGAQRIKGYAPSEIIGRHFSLFYPPEDIAAGKPANNLAVAARDGRVEDEGWRLRKDGTAFWASVVITALRDETGTLVGFGKVTRDLTERRMAEEAMRQNEERFRLLVERVRDYAIFMLDPDGRIASWNAGAEAINGYHEQEIIGRHFSVFYTAEDVASGKPRRELEIASRTGVYEEEGWRVRKNGAVFWSSVVITAVRNSAGELVGYAKVTRDLTERRAAQERAIADARRVAEAEAASRTKSEFLTAMSHELRTPINATMGYAQLLETEIGGPITERQREYLTRLRGSQEHLLHIVTDLLNYSRIEAGQVEYDVGPVPLRSVVETVISMVAPQAAAKSLVLDYTSCPPELAGTADQAKTVQIVLNLLSNAVKFTPPGGRISVSCDLSGERVSIAVQDTGPGIPADKCEAIFEPFVQLGRSLTSRHEGTGLGLAISRDLARAMGGDVTVESTVGQGATFTLWLRADGAERP
ncbi:MAG TPA: PAS domain-containing sensor histidine kinase [Gemmatimonadaceae bacterium]|nr:PAS domain-containing sensor histidine kinase [Gemmatimonadaceae bacterium]